MQFDILHATQEELNKVNPDPHTQVLLEILKVASQVEQTFVALQTEQY